MSGSLNALSRRATCTGEPLHLAGRSAATGRARSIPPVGRSGARRGRGALPAGRTRRGERQRPKNLALVIDSAPQTRCLAVDPDKHFIKVPAPVRTGTATDAAFPDLGCERRTKAVPPVPYRLMTDVDTAHKQQIFDLSKRQGVTGKHHHRNADHLRRCLEAIERALRSGSPGGRPHSPNAGSADSARR